MPQAAGSSGPGSLEPSSTDVYQQTGNSVWKTYSQSDHYHALSDASLFSSSLPVLGHEKLNLNVKERKYKLFDDALDSLNIPHPDLEGNGIIEDGGNHVVGILLPDDEDELLAGIADGIDIGWLPNHVDNSEEYDLFGSGGGMELESDRQENARIGISNLGLSNGSVSNGETHYHLSNGIGTISGEHPLGEHPSRTLFVRNINSNVEDMELRALFEQYGDIRTLYTACKHRGFVMISYYDIRAARNAMRLLQNKPLRRRKLDIHFSIPKENPSDKDINQGTLVVFNLEPFVSNDDLLHIFGAYGEVKEIRETPHKRHHKFVEYYDTRAAEAALKALNRSDIAGKRIKLEPSRPGGARRSLMLQVNHVLEQDEQKLHHQVGSSIGNSPAIVCMRAYNHIMPANWPKHGSPMELNSLQHFNRSSGFSPSSSSPGTNLPGLASVLQPPVPSGKVALAGKDYLRDGHLGHIFTNRNPNRIGDYMPLSFPEQKSDQYTFNRANAKPPSSQQFLWGSPEFTNSFSPRAQAIRHHVVPSGGGFPLSNNGSFPHPSQFQQLHHVGSAPSGFPFERRIGFYEYSPRTSYIGPFEGMGTSDGDWSFPIIMSPLGSLKPSAVSRKMESGSPDFPISGSKLSPVVQDNVNFPGVSSSKLESFPERGRSWHFESKGINSDSVKQFQLDLDKIRSGEDTRTTLMIKNIPNKYTSKMLLATIDEHHRGTYDFLYLPIDFKNKCNVGYAFINMLSLSHIVPFYEAFSGKKWEKFNSEKVASLAYARIQGRSALVSHFQNSSLMNEDKRCRPILIDAESQELIDQFQENFPSSSSRIQVGQSNGANVMKTSSSQL